MNELLLLGILDGMGREVRKLSRMLGAIVKMQADLTRWRSDCPAEITMELEKALAPEGSESMSEEEAVYGRDGFDRVQMVAEFRLPVPLSELPALMELMQRCYGNPLEIRYTRGDLFQVVKLMEKQGVVENAEREVRP